jgi:hypothetical protein
MSTKFNVSSFILNVLIYLDTFMDCDSLSITRVFIDDPMTTKPTKYNTHVPLYATGYEDERKKQARRRNFRFGLGADDRFDPDVLHNITF